MSGNHTYTFEWPAPNYPNPQSRGSDVEIIVSICIAIITIVITARIYARAFIVRWLGLDDWLAIPAAITGLGFCTIALLGTRYGWYIHIWDLRQDRTPDAQKLILASSVVGVLNVGLTKLSILCLYRRLTPETWFRATVNIVIVATIVWTISTLVATFLRCIPLHALWDVVYDGPQKCFGETPYLLAFAAIDLGLDVVVWTMPLFFIIPMRLPRRQKITLIATFAVGLLTIACAALRLPSLIRTASTYDWSWESYDAAIFTAIEATVSLACASVPAFKPFIARHAPCILGSDVSASGALQRGSGSRFDQPQVDDKSKIIAHSTLTAYSDEERRDTMTKTKTSDIETLRTGSIAHSGEKPEGDLA